MHITVFGERMSALTHEPDVKHGVEDWWYGLVSPPQGQSTTYWVDTELLSKPKSHVAFTLEQSLDAFCGDFPENSPEDPRARQCVTVEVKLFKLLLQANVRVTASYFFLLTCMLLFTSNHVLIKYRQCHYYIIHWLMGCHYEASILSSRLCLLRHFFEPYLDQKEEVERLQNWLDKSIFRPRIYWINFLKKDQKHIDE